MKVHSKYSYSAKNTEKDNIFATRLKLIYKNGINPTTSPKMYAYYMNAYLGVVLN